MEVLPFDMLNEISDRLLPRSILNFAQTSQFFYDIVYKRIKIIENKEDFERICKRGDYLSVNKIEIKHDWEYEGLARACESDLDVTFLIDLIKTKTSFFPWDQILQRACEYGNKNTINHLLKIIKDPNLCWAIQAACKGGHLELTKQIYDLAVKNNRELNLSDLLRCACIGGNKEVVDFILEIGSIDFNYGLWGACNGNHKEIAQYMIQKGADEWNWGLSAACGGGHIESINFMIEKGATNWDWGLEQACMEGHINAAELMITRGATNWKPAFKKACHGTKFDLIKFFVNKGFINQENLNKGLEISCCQYDTRLFDFLIEKDIDYDSLNKGFRMACAEHNDYLMQRLIEYGVGPNGGWNYGLEGACMNDDEELVNLMIEKGAGPNGGWNMGLEGACSSFEKNTNLIQLMIEKGAGPNGGWNMGLRGACKGCNIKAAELMIKRGANVDGMNMGLTVACKEGISDILLQVTELMIYHGATQCSYRNCYGHDFSIPKKKKKIYKKR